MTWILAQAHPHLEEIPAFVQGRTLPPGTAQFTLVTFLALLGIVFLASRFLVRRGVPTAGAGSPPPPGPSLRRAGGTVARVAFIVVLFFTAWEACVSVYVATRPVVMRNPVYEPDPLLAFRLRPGARGAINGNPVVVNSMGLRERELSLAKPAGEIRILCVGDSNTFGYCVSPELAWPRQLEALLQAQHTGKAIRVINAGVPGYTFLQGYLLLREVGLRYHPDLVIAGPLHDLHAMDWKGEHYEILSVSTAAPPLLFPLQVDLARLHLYNVLREEIRRARIAWGSGHEGAEGADLLKSREQQAALRGHFEERFIEECSRLGLPLVMTEPVEPWVRVPPGSRMAVARSPVQRLLSDPERYCFPADRVHLNGEGNRIVATVLARFIEDHHFLE